MWNIYRSWQIFHTSSRIIHFPRWSFSGLSMRSVGICDVHTYIHMYMYTHIFTYIYIYIHVVASSTHVYITCMPQTYRILAQLPLLVPCDEKLHRKEPLGCRLVLNPIQQCMCIYTYIYIYMYIYIYSYIHM